MLYDTSNSSFALLLFSHPVVSNSLWPHGLQHTRFPCPSSHGVCVNFPDSSVGEETTCNAGDPGSIPGLGRSPGEGIGYPLQYFRASLVAQLVKNLPAMWETWVWSLGWEDPLEEDIATQLQYSCLESLHGQRSLAGCSPWGHKESDTTEWLSRRLAD